MKKQTTVSTVSTVSTPPAAAWTEDINKSMSNVINTVFNQSTYDSMTIADIERKIKELSVASRESMRDMYFALEYLRISNRFKENPGYKKAVFWQYLEDIFTIREGTYRENVRAFLKFPDESAKYGVGVVAKIDRVCGCAKAKKVMDEIRQKTELSKKPLPRSTIETIIQKNRMTTKIEKTITDWHAMYEAEKIAHQQTIESLKVANAIIYDLNDQIVKLKATARKISNIREMLDGVDSLGAKMHEQVVQAVIG